MSSSSSPSSTVDFAGKTYKHVREGLADILAPAPIDGAEVKKTSAGGEEQAVFYNPIQTFNRDLSVLAAKVFAEELVAGRQAEWARKASRNAKKNARKSNKRKREEGEEGVNAGGEVVEGEKRARTDESAMMVDSEVADGGNVVTGAQAESTTTDGPANATSAQATADVAPDAERQASKTQESRPIPFRILDALSATGLRALRYAKEIPEATLVTANDLSREAVESIRRNVEYNNVQKKVHPLEGNAMGHMYLVGTEQRMPDGVAAKYDVIDLDPYGTAAPFLDAAVQAVSDGGMLAVTCTDSGVFASVGYLEKAYSQYGGLPWKGSQSHEAGLRLIINAVAKSAARYGLAIEPLLSLSIDYYVRIFIRVRKSPAEVKLLPGKTMTVYNCDTGCKAWKNQYHVRTSTREGKGGEFHHFTAAQGPTTTPHCEHCGFRTHIAGPMWGGYLHNPYFVQRLLDKLPQLDDAVYTTQGRLEGMLTMALNETLLPVDPKADSKTNDKPASNGTAESASTGNQPNESDSKPNPAPYKPLQRLNPALPDEHCFFIVPSELSKVLHTTAPKEAALRGAFVHLGYRVTSSHTKANTIRTDAPWPVIWDVMRAWVYQNTPEKVRGLKEGTAGTGIWHSSKSADHKELEKTLMSFLGGNKQKAKAAMAMIEAIKDTKQEGDGPAAEATNEDNKAEGPGGDAADESVIKDSQDGPADAGRAAATDASPSSQGMALSAAGKMVPVVFDERLGVDPDKGRIMRYQINPRKDWGPQARAK